MMNMEDAYTTNRTQSESLFPPEEEFKVECAHVLLQSELLFALPPVGWFDVNLKLEARLVLLLWAAEA